MEDSDYEAVYEDIDEGEAIRSLTEFNRFNVDGDFKLIGPCVYMNTSQGQGGSFTNE